MSLTRKTMETERTDSIAGLVERVIFSNEENGFAILRVKLEGKKSEATVLGSLASVAPGEKLEAKGSWVEDKDHGLQFQAAEWKTSPPVTLEGVEKYLCSGLIKGIGPSYAQKLTKKFGLEVFDIIENFSARLGEVSGLGPKKRKLIRESWLTQKAVRELMLFLHSHGVTANRAMRIYKTYGESAIQRIRQNPYDLAQDVFGIGFKTADQIAARLGIAKDSEKRLRAGLLYVLGDQTSLGHCALPEERLLDATERLLEVDEKPLQCALADLLASGRMMKECLGGHELIFPPELAEAERQIAGIIHHRVALPPPYPAFDFEKTLAAASGKIGKELSAEQREALRMVFQHPCLIVTGGPGVGKSTLLQTLLRMQQAHRARCVLCAPTGRAAKRMSEITGATAKTIHRLLEFNGLFGRDEHHPLEGDLVVVDEMSMVDVPLFAALLRALPPKAGLLLMGDADQLPSVGPGLVFKHLIESGKIPVARLTEIFRQAADSRIIQAAHDINRGRPPFQEGKELSDFYFIEREEPEEILQTLLEVVQNRLPKKFGLDPARDIQVLTPMNKSILGTRELNLRLQAALNPSAKAATELKKNDVIFRARDKVIQTVNDYDKDVWNGDIGKILEIDEEEREVLVDFDGRHVIYDANEQDELQLAYAITIHKSQGSEFPAVVIPLAMQHAILLQRNLLYTAVTRGRRMVVLIGQRRALEFCARNRRTGIRYSGLLDRLTLCK
ncbi:MAG: ATP-dependent RecD-like DNA helicase [bacterium]